MKKYLMMGASALVMGAMFTACSNDDGPSAEEYYQAQYSQAFEKAFGKISPNQDWGFGPEGSTRATRSGNTAGEYTPWPSTHQYYDANGKLIASANMNHNEWADPNKEFGGWLVPDALTAGQKLRVQKYFQANPNLSYQDPHFANFFIQQVYTGGTDAPETGNKEATKAANGNIHAGSTLNQLTVGQACSHINDFNAGTCSPSNVLDNGKTVNDATYHSDQITLMLNVDDTSCFGYHETGGSNVKGVINHNDKMALVSAATIDAWAAANGNPGEAVVDKWNRSFMGFDYELLPEEDIIPENPTYAKFTDVPSYNNFQYVVLNGQVMQIGSAPEATEAEEVDITATFAANANGNGVTCSYDANGNIVCEFAGEWYNAITFKQSGDFSQYDKLKIEFAEPSPIAATLTCGGDAQISEGATSVEVATVNYAYNGGGGPTISNGGVGSTPKTLVIKSVKLVKEASAPDTSIVYFNEEYLLGADNLVMYYSGDNLNQYGGVVITPSASDWTTSEGYLNLDYFKGLAEQGYHPTSGGAFQKWVKWQAACDGYYSDWIVTLTEAQRIGTTPDPDPIIPVGPTKKSIRIMAEDLSAIEASDFDFNDVVFDVEAEYAEGVNEVSQVKITLWAAGGTLPLRLNGDDNLEVHNLLGTTTNTMTNTHAFDRVDKEGKYLAADGKGNWSSTITLADGKTIRKDYFNYDVNLNLLVEVQKTGKWFTLTANQGVAACKIGCELNTPWALERSNMDKAFQSFKSWVNNSTPENWESSRVGNELYNLSGKTVWYKDKQ